MVEIISSQRHDEYGFPPKFKRPRVSAVRDYPRQCGVVVQPSSSHPVLRKYPPSKIRKGFLVTRDFPVKPNARVALLSQKSYSKSSSSAHVMSMADCKKSDVFNATNVHVCTNAKLDNLSVVKNFESSDVPNSTNIRDIHACIEPEEDDVKESSSLMVVGDEQCQAFLFGLDDSQVVLKDEEREKVASIAEEASLSDKQCSDVLSEVHDYQATFSDEEYVKATLAEMNNSQVGLSNDSMIPNNELRINNDKVKEALNLFREVYLELLHGRGGKQKGCLPVAAASLLLKQLKGINMDRRLGPVPGVEVGDYFKWRAELNIIGLHRQNFLGIDYMELNGKILATSVVDSGRYDNVLESNDEQEFSDTLIYSGEGKNPKVLSKKSVDDQKLERGNLALKNSAEAKTPVRVICKVSFKGDGSRKIGHKFVYDGLYFVDSCREEITSSGKLVFKFLLKRFPGQPKVVRAKSTRKERVCMNDISQGKERIPIRAMNALDDEKPPIFTYVTNVIYPESYHPSMTDDGCDCNDGCSDSEDCCACIIKNGGETYNYQECIMKAKPFVIECGPSCKCFTSCINRVSQGGIRFPLEVFKTETKGWGVRSQSFIRSGSFICEYMGEIIRDKEGELRIGNDEYLFDIGNNNGDDSSEVNESFIIDAAKFGNVGRFINHSCSPNLFSQNVLFDHGNRSMPHIMLFAMEDIPPLKELTYHYNYKIGSVCDANGNIKTKSCYCGSWECTGRMY
ncbi:hypothetical protein REPUB_Repub08aG0015400 [Reevesia pubescens]